MARKWLKHCLMLQFIFLTVEAQAHPLRLGSLRVQVPVNRVRASLLLPTELAKQLAAWPAIPANLQELDRATSALFTQTLALAPPRLRDKNCAWEAPVALFSGKGHAFVELSCWARCPKAGASPFRLELPLPFLEKTPEGFELVAHVEGWEGDAVLNVGRADPVLRAGEKAPPSTDSFFQLGVGHIGALPGEWYAPGRGFHLPEGIDHICFVLALLVAGGTFWQILKNVTGFTIGHSLTLALAAFQLVHVRPAFVEACVALSISFVAGSSIWRKTRSHGWLVAFVFGTVHGLAFASALKELDLDQGRILRALFGFNLGVEAGQCVILAVAMPGLFLLRRFSPRAHEIVLRVLAVLLLAVGLVWFTQRISG